MTCGDNKEEKMAKKFRFEGFVKTKKQEVPVLVDEAGELFIEEDPNVINELGLNEIFTVFSKNPT